MNKFHLLLSDNFTTLNVHTPFPLTAPSQEWVCGRSPAEAVGLNPAGGTDICLSVVYCQVEVFATSWSLVQRSPTDYGASSCVI